MVSVKWITRWVCACMVVGMCASAYPQESTTGTAMIEEIIVTAQKREENLQETPVSVTAFTADAIEAFGFRQSVDITAQTPNFSVGYPNGDTGVPAPFIRGVGLNDFGVLNQGPVAAYTDETYISSNAAQIFQLLDVERVEVLRGPQGTQGEFCLQIGKFFDQLVAAAKPTVAFPLNLLPTLSRQRLPLLGAPDEDARIQPVLCAPPIGAVVR